MTLRAEAGGLSRPEVVAALGFLTVPVVMWVLARLVTHAYLFRYGLVTVIGACVLLGWLLVLPGARAVERLAIVALLVAVPLRLKEHLNHAGTVAALGAYSSYATRLADCFDTIAVFDSPLDFLPVYHSDRAGTESRFYHPEDAEAELRFNDDDTTARAFAGLGRYRDVHAPPFQGFVSSHRRFLLVTRPSYRHTWIPPSAARGAGARLELVSVEGDMSAYLVTLPEGRAPTVSNPTPR